MNGVLFGNKHSLKDWGVYLIKKPKITPPSIKTTYIEIPCANGSLDLTEVMSDDVKYENREITCEFLVKQDRSEWDSIYSKIMDYLHGKKMKIIFDEEPNFYYEGRCFVSDWESSQIASKIVVKANVSPYKLERYSSLEAWKWDEFNFETDIIRDYKDIYVNGSRTLVIEGRRMRVIPTFDVAGEMKVEFNGNSYQLPLGKSRILNIELVEGTNELTFTGNGTVSVEYRGGRL